MTSTTPIGGSLSSEG